MDDLLTLVVLVSLAFFVALGFGLLLRYRKVSQKINASTDLGRDLWQALEQRLRKQDERILDVMGRVEVIQFRFTDRPVMGPAVTAPIASTSEPKPVPVTEMAVVAYQPKLRVTLDETQETVIKLLNDRPRSSVEIKELLGKSREHTARLMKSLFDRGLVTRDDSKKPFVYELSEMGRRYLSAS